MGRCAAADLVRATQGCAGNVLLMLAVSFISTIKVLSPPLKVIACANTSKYFISQRYFRSCCRHKTSMCAISVTNAVCLSNLPFTAHVWAGKNNHLLLLGIENKIIRNIMIASCKVPLYYRVPAFFYIEMKTFVQLGFYSCRLQHCWQNTKDSQYGEHISHSPVWSNIVLQLGKQLVVTRPFDGHYFIFGSRNFSSYSFSSGVI